MLLSMSVYTLKEGQRTKRCAKSPARTPPSRSSAPANARNRRVEACRTRKWSAFMPHAAGLYHGSQWTSRHPNSHLEPLQPTARGVLFGLSIIALIYRISRASLRRVRHVALVVLRSLGAAPQCMGAESHHPERFHTSVRSKALLWSPSDTHHGPYMVPLSTDVIPSKLICIQKKPRTKGQNDARCLPMVFLAAPRSARSTASLHQIGPV